ncbi:MAG: RloB family protein [Lentisphaeria bacterium]|jgi:hypothetical protein|nr:RloB family protein [Lentisphaeria bacterium]
MRKNNFIERGWGRKVGPVLHIYCEGETEESYLNAYKRFRKYSCCEIEHSHHTDPVGLIQEAIKAKENAPSSDSYWVVYDLEDVSLENKRQTHVEAYRLAQANGIHIALSAISIEVWILLHFTPTPKVYLNCDGAVRALKKYLPNYEKGSANVFNAIQNLIPYARKNAVSLQRRWEHDRPNGKPYELNPSTSFHLLLDAIDQIG